ncbi:alcohol dehydrogenase catalytic domain-containing protein [Psychrobacillus soli]|uniref:Zinc-binding dehydrogenase n=1 Tax=Psychrobacillus soli TaxID=1543965 RepID=A0A544TMZ1_9BACI|nr:alcohol dehydrogenase catalytic domain-containing protein [Psychrobacillus soli]TQR18775.1 zinc-binding dehydrogenase [Psychrobacillus soli]
MKGLVKFEKGPSGVRLIEIESKPLREKELLVKIHAAGICGTDLHIMEDEYPYNAPVVLGHEYSGIVVEVGSEVMDFSVGDRVVSLTAASTCGNCVYCDQGLLMLCKEKQSIGSQVDGAFTEYITIPEKIAFKITSGVSLDEAALTEPLACAVRCIMERGNVQGGDLVLVSGPGTIGMLALLVAKANGGRVVVAGTHADRERLEFAKKLGAVDTVVIDSEESMQQVMAKYPFDVAIECAGHEVSLDNCIRLLKMQGNLIQMGLFGKKIKFNSDLVLMKELHYSNGFATEPTSWRIALNLLENKLVDVRPLISNKVELSDWERGIQLVKDKVGYKTLLIPNV